MNSINKVNSNAVVFASTTNESEIPSPEPQKSAASQRNSSGLTSSLDQLNPQRSSSLAERVFSVLFRETASSASRASLEARVNGEKQVVVTTDDGYSITFTGKQQEWKITSPNGKTTRIWGDPHVEESDGDTWDFLKKSSFLLGENKITVETVELGNGTSYSGTVTIYNGEDRFTITGLDTNKPQLVDWTFDAEEHDNQLSDGDLYRLSFSENGQEEWTKEKS